MAKVIAHFIAAILLRFMRKKVCQSLFTVGKKGGLLDTSQVRTEHFFDTYYILVKTY